MSTCPTCGAWSSPDPDTGYDGDDFCSARCEEESQERDQQIEDDRRPSAQGDGDPALEPVA